MEDRTAGPQGVGPGGAWLRALIREAAAALGDRGWQDGVPEVRRILAEALEDAGTLPAEELGHRDGAFHSRLLHAQAAPAFSVVVVSAQPGAASRIHDHVAWCVMGLQRGRLMSTRYRVSNREGLIEQETVRLVAGDTIVLLPPDDDIHSVRCEGSAPAVAVHLYGADLSGGRHASARVFGRDAFSSAREARPSAGRWLTRAAAESRERC